MEVVKTTLSNVRDYNYGSKPDDLKADLEMREVHTFSSGVKYKGQWNAGTNKPEGKGWKIDNKGTIIFGWWKDGKLYKRARKVSYNDTFFEYSVENEEANGFMYKIIKSHTGWFGPVNDWKF